MGTEYDQSDRVWGVARGLEIRSNAICSASVQNGGA